MVGGMGTRLMPYTKFVPKTLLKISGKPIIVHILDRLQQNGFNNIYLSINHLGKLIKKTIKHNNLNKLNIQFVVEKKKLDTAGSLSLIKKKLKKDFIVTNGDVITNINYDDLLKFHLKFKADATMAVKKYEFKNPYGEIKIKNYHILDFIEKPIYNTFVNAGVYVFHPKILKLLKYNEKISMHDLFKKIKLYKLKVLAYPIHENWIDIGTPETYLSANKIVNEE
jgi:NDP-sugar pyrophosphorylase family protein